MPKVIDIDHEILTQRLDYDKHSGVLSWADSPLNAARFRGKTAGHVRVSHTGKAKQYSYTRHKPLITHKFSIGGKQYNVSDAIWYYVTGQQPPEIVDHIDGNRLNNRWDNLRAATQETNAKNRCTVPGRKGQYLGVCALKSGKFRAVVSHGTSANKTIKRTYIGTFDTAREAGIAAAKEYVRQRGMLASYQCLDLLREENILGEALAAHKQFVAERAMSAGVNKTVKGNKK